MRVLVYGGRGYQNFARLCQVLDFYHAWNPFTCLIQGEARGADTLARRWAVLRGVKVDSYPAEWDKHGLRAGMLRNTRMRVEGVPAMGIAFAGGKGTANMTKQLREHNIPVIEVAP